VQQRAAQPTRSHAPVRDYAPSRRAPSLTFLRHKSSPRNGSSRRSAGRSALPCRAEPEAQHGEGRENERAASDAILVGANTIRRDNPRLLVRSAVRQADRAHSGRPSSPAKVTVTASAELSPDSRFFTAGEADIARIVFCPEPTAARLAQRLDGLPGVEVVATGDRVGLASVLSALTVRGIGRLLAEGGTMIHTQLLARA
jgi:riboflavin biosynthesis pyrimidine reductase